MIYPLKYTQFTPYLLSAEIVIVSFVLFRDPELFLGTVLIDVSGATTSSCFFLLYIS